MACWTCRANRGSGRQSWPWGGSCTAHGVTAQSSGSVRPDSKAPWVVSTGHLPLPPRTACGTDPHSVHASLQPVSRTCVMLMPLAEEKLSYSHP